MLLSRVERVDSLLAEYNEKHPHQITAAVITDILADKPLLRKDQGKDFVEFAIERLNSDYARNRIWRSRLEERTTLLLRRGLFPIRLMQDLSRFRRANPLRQSSEDMFLITCRSSLHR